MVSQLLKENCPNLKSLDDEEVLQLVHRGHKQALDHLIQKYKGFIRAKARTYYLIGGDREDIMQEGLIGLYKAIRNFDQDKLSSFKAFAEMCVTRQMITAIKTATRQKHIPLNSYVSLDKPMFEEESERTLMDVIAGPSEVDPQELLVHRESSIDIERKLSEVLSRFEREVLNLYVDGYTYQEISGMLNCHVKSIDNALQRIKRKLEHDAPRSRSVIHKKII
nr:RNA polymerase sporulation sigma factor SigH [Lentibacillus sp. JNUCC-1]